MIKGNFRAEGFFRFCRFRQGVLIQNLCQAHHGFIRLHDRLRGVHNTVDHGAAGRGKERVKDEIRQYTPAVSSRGQQNCGRNQQNKGTVDTGQKGCLAVSTAHGVLTCQIAVGLDGRVESFEGTDRLLKHLYHGNSSHVFYGLPAHLLDLLLIAVEKSRVLSTHHGKHADHGENHRQKTQKPHPPVKDKQENDRRYGSYHRGCQVRQLVGQQILRQGRVVIDNFAETAGLISREKSQGKPHHMSHAGVTDIPRRSESRDMGAHQSRKIYHNICHREPDRHPSPDNHLTGMFHSRVGRQGVSGYQPDTDVGHKSQNGCDAGQRASQQGKFFVSSGIPYQF